MSTLLRHPNGRTTVEPAPAPEPILEPEGVTLPEPVAEPTDAARPSRWLAALRISTGFIFLWAFFDKLLGLGYATPSEGAWINGGSPTEGYLSSVNVGPFQSLYNDMAGQAWADWLFMLGLAGVGVAVVLGIGMRIAAVSGTLMMMLMWAAAWPLAQHDAAGELTRSTNPLVDYHVIYALALIVLAVTHAGRHYGLGEAWARLPIVRRFRGILE